MPSRRASRHAVAAARLEARGGPLALIAVHLLAARKVVDVDRVARMVCNAAEAAVRRYAADSAIDPVLVGLLEVRSRRCPRSSVRFARLAAALTPASSDEQMGRATGYAREALAIAREIDDVPTRLHTLAWSTSALNHVLPLPERVDLTSELVSAAREHFDAAIIECRDMASFLALSEDARARCESQARRLRSNAMTTMVALSREGDVWLVTSSMGAPFRGKRTKGMTYLDHILHNAGREVYALILEA